jgi:glycosyltransferase involved in cell wall biosynthesis
VVLSEMSDISVWCNYSYGKVVYDLVDSYLAIPRSSTKQWLRGAVWYAVGRHRRLRFDYWAILQDMCRRAEAVVCTTEEQKLDIQPYCPNVHVVLDVQSSVVRKVKKDYRCGEPFNLVWEGLPTNIPQLLHIRDVLREVHKHRPLVLNIVTDPDQPRLLGRFGRVRSLDLARRAFDAVRLHPWGEETLSEIICDYDMGVIPIDLSDPFVTGKPENKLVLFWRMGMPVVTSATPAYRRAMRQANSEALACTDRGEWRAALETMMSDQALRRQAGERGHAIAEERYNAASLLERWDEVFASIGCHFGEDKVSRGVS